MPSSALRRDRAAHPAQRATSRLWGRSRRLRGMRLDDMRRHADGLIRWCSRRRRRPQESGDGGDGRGGHKSDGPVAGSAPMPVPVPCSARRTGGGAGMAPGRDVAMMRAMHASMSLPIGSAGYARGRPGRRPRAGRAPSGPKRRLRCARSQHQLRAVETRVFPARVLWPLPAQVLGGPGIVVGDAPGRPTRRPGGSGPGATAFDMQGPSTPGPRHLRTRGAVPRRRAGGSPGRAASVWRRRGRRSGPVRWDRLSRPAVPPRLRPSRSASCRRTALAWRRRKLAIS